MNERRPSCTSTSAIGGVALVGCAGCVAIGLNSRCSFGRCQLPLRRGLLGLLWLQNPNTIIQVQGYNVGGLRVGDDRRVAVVTGGASGIGKAIASRLSDDGATVHILDSSTVDWPTSHRVDVSDEAAVRAVVSAIGTIDIAVNVAGIHGGYASSWEMPDGRFERVLAVNLNGAFYVCRAVLPGMIQGGWGRIVNISSISARDGVAGASAYAASKAGLIGLTRAIAKEVAAAGVLVNCVAPGAIDTPMLDSSGNRDAAAMRSPMQRLGLPEEVAALVAWLCSDECSFSTGAVFDVSGGRATW
jgi:2-dehydro-3-deoxy-L-rhamnonate dehydrogenase (NAD+)